MAIYKTLNEQVIQYFNLESGHILYARQLDTNVKRVSVFKNDTLVMTKDMSLDEAKIYVQLFNNVGYVPIYD